MTKDNIEEATSHLIHSRSASAVYYILNGKGKNIVI